MLESHRGIALEQKHPKMSRFIPKKQRLGAWYGRCKFGKHAGYAWICYVAVFLNLCIVANRVVSAGRNL